MADPIILSGSVNRGNGANRFFNIRGPVSDDPSRPYGTGSTSTSADWPSSPALIGTTQQSIPVGIRAAYGVLRGIGYASDMNMTNTDGTPSFERRMSYGVGKNDVSGSSSDQCLQIDYPGSWRFRWVVKSGTRTISILAKQNSTGSSFRPSMIVKANPSIGVMQDVSGSAADGGGWVTIGPLSISPTVNGPLWVELWNNNNYYPTITGSLMGEYMWPVLFDHIVTT